jgi:uncharacterized protein YecT (DUF1311 family)
MLAGRRARLLRRFLSDEGGSMVFAVLLAAVSASPCSTAQTQREMDVCWSAQAAHAGSDLAVTYAHAIAQLRKRGIDPALLETVERSWTAARDGTCAFETSLYEGGSIAPMIQSECIDRMTRHQRQWLERLLAAPALPSQPGFPASQSAAAHLDRILASLNARVGAAQRKDLKMAESAWAAYRDRACKLQGDDCLTEFTQERAIELESGWIGEPLE